MVKSPFHHDLRNSAGIKLLKGENIRTRRLLDGEEQALLDSADQLYCGNCVDHRHIARVMRARIEGALDLGMRRGEMLRIQNRDVDWSAKPFPILILRAENTKSRRQRKLPLVSPRILKWLNDRRAVGSATGHPYGDERGGYVKHFNSAWRLVLKGAGITDPAKKLDSDLRWHNLRHECGSRLAERGMDVRKVQGLLGHSTHHHNSALLQHLRGRYRHSHAEGDGLVVVVPELSRHHLEVG